MNFEKNAKKTIVKIKVFQKFGKAFIKSSMDTVSDKICLASYKHFDPYTSSVYETMMHDQLENDRIETMAVKRSFKLVNQVIDEMI